MLQIGKTDPALGLEVHNHLVSLGLETPIKDVKHISDEEKVKLITEQMTLVMNTLGLDLLDDSLVDTPKRIAKMYVYEKFWGLLPENFPKCTTVENKMGYNETVTEKNIRVLSDCEHHLVQIDGYATVSYIPKDIVLGLSKLNRIVEYFSRRPQIQERLTQQIGETLKYILKTEDVAVSVNAKHYCVIARGVEDQSSNTITNYLCGAYRNDSMTRSEFMSVVAS